MQAAASTAQAARACPVRYRVLLLGAEYPLGRAVMRQLAGGGHALTPVAAGRPGPRTDGTMPLVTITDAARLRDAVAAHDLLCNMMPVASSPHGTIGHALRRPERRRRSAMHSWLRAALEAKPATILIQRSTALLYQDAGSGWISEACRAPTASGSQQQHHTDQPGRRTSNTNPAVTPQAALQALSADHQSPSASGQILLATPASQSAAP